VASRRHDPAIRLAGALPPAVRRRLVAMAPDGLSRDALTRAYIDEERSAASIARENGCRVSTVLFHLALQGIPLRGTKGR
jgi:hypothetical protein